MNRSPLHDGIETVVLCPWFSMCWGCHRHLQCHSHTHSQLLLTLKLRIHRATTTLVSGSASSAKASPVLRETPRSLGGVGRDYQVSVERCQKVMVNVIARWKPLM